MQAVLRKADNTEIQVGIFADAVAKRSYIEGSDANKLAYRYANRKQFSDIWFKEKAVREQLQKVVIEFMASKHALGLSAKEARLLAARVSIVLSRFVRNGVINPVEYDWENNGYSNIVTERPGYVITSRPISEMTQAAISQRNGYSLGVCFIVNEPQHRIGIQICEVSVLTSEITG